MMEAISERTIEELKKIEHQLSRINEIVRAGKKQWQGESAAVRYDNYSDAVEEVRRVVGKIKADHSIDAKTELHGSEEPETIKALPDHVIE